MDMRLAVEMLLLGASLGSAAFYACATHRIRMRDRALIAGLQKSIATPASRLSGIAVGSATHSASPGVHVGGDVVDVFDLDRRYAMICVADLSGKGVEAAARAAFITYTIRTLALENDGDPAVVLAKFNAIYTRTVDDYESFVVMILGVIDSQTGEVRYASAGHEPAFLRRNGSVSVLAPTGPIVGVSEFSAYRTESLVLSPSDMLVWTTDGMTEGRDTGRALLGVDGLAAWIAAAPADAPGTAASLIGSLRRRSGALQDDVAVLAISCDASAAFTPASFAAVC